MTSPDDEHRDSREQRQQATPMSVSERARRLQRLRELPAADIPAFRERYLRAAHASGKQEAATLAEVRFDFSEFPVTQIPYLTAVKWALSTREEWPLMHEKKAALTLGDDEARRLFCDDLRRSLDWRPNTGVTLDWDRGGLGLAVRWESGPVSSQSRPVFAKLAEVIQAAGRDGQAMMLSGSSESAAALDRALAEAGKRPAPGPAFRVDFTQLDLTSARIRDPDGTSRPATSSREVYERFRTEIAATRNGASADPRVRFDDAAQTVEFDNWDAIRALGHGAHTLRALAGHANLATPQVHPDSPAPATRTLRWVREAAIHREIERAFGVPGHQEARQTARRDLNVGVTAKTVASVYQQYDAALTPEALKDIHESVKRARPGRYGDAFTKMFARGGFIIGEDHSRTHAYDFVTAHMEEMKENHGLTHICLETFEGSAHQRLIDEYLKSGVMDPALRALVTRHDERRGRPVHRDLLEKARMLGVGVIATEHPEAYQPSGVGRLRDSERARAYDVEKRLAYHNMAAARTVAQQAPSGRTVHIVGEAHVHPSSFGCPGLAQFRKLPAVELRTSLVHGVTVVPLRETRDRRTLGGSILGTQAAVREVRRLNPDAYNAARRQAAIDRRAAPRRHVATPDPGLRPTGPS